ncbi:MAG: SDR family NAD(P)-dependent oxidoreductase [Brevundimonas sp.]
MDASSASKTAIQGFTDSLAHELAFFGVRVKLVEPGYGPTTRFSENSDVDFNQVVHEAYADFAAPVLEACGAAALTTAPSDVAEAVWTAVHEPGDRLHFPAGPDALALAAAVGR